MSDVVGLDSVQHKWWRCGVVPPIASAKPINWLVNCWLMLEVIGEN